MKYKSVILAGFIFCGTTFGAQKDIILIFDGAGEGMTRIFAIDNIHAQKLPNWVPGNGDLPIKVSDAYIKAREVFLKEGALGGTPFKLTDIRLAHKSTKSREIWFYTITFVENDPNLKPQPGSYSIELKSRIVVVLLDGTVLKGRVIPEIEFFKRISGR